MGWCSKLSLVLTFACLKITRTTGCALLLLPVLLLSIQSLAADVFTKPKIPSVQVAAPAPVTVVKGKTARIELSFRVDPGFHINSNAPHNDTLMPTVLRLSAPTDVLIGKISYPPGRDFTFDFLPGEKLNVYTGDFLISAVVTTSRSIAAGTYRVHGGLKYQACDNLQCYEPREVPLEFDVKVTSGGAQRVRRNPGQSPHVH